MLKLEVSGNLGADAEVKESNGRKFVSFRVAHTDKWTGEDNVSHENTTWVDCVMSNAESKVIPYLKQGTKVIVRGNCSTRVYSSQKDRCMKAGLQIQVQELELIGGSGELVPRQLIVPETGVLLDVQKYYWCNCDTKGMKKEDTRMLIDARGYQYVMDNRGFVAPAQQEQENISEENQPSANDKQK